MAIFERYSSYYWRNPFLTSMIMGGSVIKTVLKPPNSIFKHAFSQHFQECWGRRHGSQPARHGNIEIFMTKFQLRRSFGPLCSGILTWRFGDMVWM